MEEEKTNNESESNDIAFERDSEFSEHVQRENKDVVADLRAKLKKSNDEKAEYLAGWQRAKADFINSRKQDQEANSLMIKFAEADLIGEIIPVLVSFDLAFSNETALEKVPADWRKGIENIRNNLLSVLTAHNVEVIDPIGKPFDPNVSEAVGMIDTDKPEEDHVVLSVFQKGYKLYDRVISPAKVRVGRYTK